MTKINMGCGPRNFGKEWIHIDGGSYEHLDYNSIVILDQFKNNTIDLIYASHVIEYFDREEIAEVLREWRRVLKRGGILRLAVPNFESIIKIYKTQNCSLENCLGLLYGKMSMGGEKIYHRTVYDFESLSGVLKKNKMKNVRKYNWKDTDHGEYDDHSQAYFPHMDKEEGLFMSLNVECEK